MDREIKKSDEELALERPEIYYRIYDALWRNIDREDALVNQRINWAVLLSSGLFAATALLANAAISEKLASVPSRCDASFLF